MTVLIWILAIVVLFALVLVGVWFSGGRSNMDEIAIAESEIGMPLESRRIDTGEVHLHVVFAGPESGERVILIHGFPEFWYSWRYQIAVLAKSGFRIAAVDLRGYNRSDKPHGRASYTNEAYGRDIVGLMDVLGWDRAHLAGHDVGAGVVWRLVFEASERISSALVFNVGHPNTLADTDNSKKISWYRTFFRTPFLAEIFSRTIGLKMTADMGLIATSHPGTFSDEEVALYISAWERDHAYDTMIGAYRAVDQPMEKMPADGRPTVPVRLLYGMQDRFLSEDRARRTEQYIGSDNVKYFEGLGHWMLSEDPELTSAEMIEFFNGSDRR